MSTPSDDEARAALWRDQQRRRVAFQTQLYQQLAGNPAAATALRESWEPIEAWLLERQAPDWLGSQDPDVDPLGLSDQVNVGT